MTSGSDDLEQELRRNLKLRRELGTEAAKGKAALNAKQRGGVAYRLGGFCIGLVSRSLVCMQLSGWWSYKTHLGKESSAILRTGLQSLGWPFLLSGSMRSVAPSATSSLGSKKQCAEPYWLP
jgi:hypothetical protein